MKLFKQKIRGFVGSVTSAEDIEGSSVGINQNYRTSFNVTDTDITVKVEKIIKPDLTRLDNIDVEIIPEITFETVVEKVFTPSDFPKTTDHISWYVTFDVQTESISEPKQLFDLVQNNGNTTKKLWETYYGLFNFNTVPLFFLQNFDRLAEGFSKSVLITYYDSGNTPAILDTVIEESVAGDFEDINLQGYITWSLANIAPKIEYSITDEQGNPVSATVVQRTEQQSHNQYRVSLAPGIYTVDITFTKAPYSNLSNRYDIDTINGIVNKNRIDIASGTVPVQYNLSGLVSGEIAKLKLNVGKFRSFSELWVDIV